jgi:hypothetical protein
MPLHTTINRNAETQSTRKPDLSQLYHRLPAAAKADFPLSPPPLRAVCAEPAAYHRHARMGDWAAGFVKAGERFAFPQVLTSPSQARDLSLARSGRSSRAARSPVDALTLPIGACPDAHPGLDLSSPRSRAALRDLRPHGLLILRTPGCMMTASYTHI